jgi:hypothetical protein
MEHRRTSPLTRLAQLGSTIRQGVHLTALGFAVSWNRVASIKHANTIILGLLGYLNVLLFSLCLETGAAAPYALFFLAGFLSLRSQRGMRAIAICSIPVAMAIVGVYAHQSNENWGLIMLLYSPLVLAPPIFWHALFYVVSRMGKQQ